MKGETTVTNTEKTLSAVGNTARSVKELVALTDLSESIVRKALKTLVDDDQVTMHATTPATWSKDTPYSLEATVEQFLGKRARSAGYLHKRLTARGVTATQTEVRSALFFLVAAGRAAKPFKSARFARA